MASQSVRRDLPQALRLFPRLQDYTTFYAFNPRHARLPPLGSTVPFEDEQAKHAVRHLYHDLGVLAFEGCSHDQTQTVGNIIRDSVEMGGPGGISARITLKGAMQHTRFDPPEPRWSTRELRQPANRKAFKEIENRIVDEYAVPALKEHVRKIFSIPDSQTIELVQRRRRLTLAKSKHLSRNITHGTNENGITLPVDVFTSVGPSPIFERNVLGTVRLHTGGALGRFLGDCRIRFIVKAVDPSSSTSTPKTWDGRDIPAEDAQIEETQSLSRVHEMRVLVRARLLDPLMQLERAVYGDKLKLLEPAPSEDAGGEEIRGKMSKA